LDVQVSDRNIGRANTETPDLLRKVADEKIAGAVPIGGKGSKHRQGEREKTIRVTTLFYPFIGQTKGYGGETEGTWGGKIREGGFQFSEEEREPTASKTPAYAH